MPSFTNITGKKTHSRTFSLKEIIIFSWIHFLLGYITRSLIIFLEQHAPSCFILCKRLNSDLSSKIASWLDKLARMHYVNYLINSVNIQFTDCIDFDWINLLIGWSTGLAHHVGITYNKCNQTKVHPWKISILLGAITLRNAVQVAGFQLECNVPVYFYVFLCILHAHLACVLDNESDGQC